jgi:protein-tyrosine phosphatase
VLLCCFAGCFRTSADFPGETGRQEIHVRDAGGVHRSGGGASHEPAQRDAEAASGDTRDAAAADAGVAGARDAAALDSGTESGAASEPDPVASAWEPEPRWILAGEIENARDLGGVPLGDSARVRPGRLFRGPPLSPLTAAGCQEFAALGIRTVIDLRISSESTSLPEAPCVEKSAAIVAAPLPVPYSVSPSDYVFDLDAPSSIATIFQKLGDPAAYPIYFHCTWGRDRTGVVAAVVLSALGASPAVIMKEYLLSQRSVGAYPASLEAVLDVIESRGGIGAQLERAGVPREHVSVLREFVRLEASE